MDGNVFNSFSYPWVTIPCDEKFNASYLCQPRHSRTRKVFKTTDITCNGDWLLLQDSKTCFLVLEGSDNKISFDDSQYMCNLHNASVLSVNVSDRVKPQEDVKDLKSLLEYVTYQNSRLKPFYPMVQKMSTINIQDLLFGRRLDAYSSNSWLPYLLYLLNGGLSEQTRKMSFFVDFSSTCSIVDFSMVSYKYAEKTDAWGVKCRTCSEKIKVPGVICEKPAERYITRCQKNHFKCRDQSCILYIYKCDHIVDCFDNSDEDTCNYSKLMSHFINVPCLPSTDCDTVNQVNVHDICDGVYNNYTFPHEKDVCVTFNQKISVPPVKSQSTYTKGGFTFTTNQIAKLFFIEQKYKCNELNNAFLFKLNHKHSNHSFLDRRIPAVNTSFSQTCINNAHSTRCTRRHCEGVCSSISCPGMFHCHEDACIPISWLCDNTYDCNLGEDETMCSTFHCPPGFLKCRGENRCISTEEICDKRVNCLHSMDDELGCVTCPVNCECIGYVMSCHSNNSDYIIESDEVYYIRGLVVRGFQQELLAKHLHFVGLLFINMSHCELKTIDISHSYRTLIFSPIIIDFSLNQLTDTIFLSVQLFYKTVFLDLSYNLLHTLKYRQYSSLTYLSILHLIGNNLQEIGITTGIGRLELIDLQFIYYTPALTLEIDHGMDVVLMIKVTDFQLCCMISNDIKCVSNKKYIICYGLLETPLTKAVFYCLSLLSFCLSIIIILKQAKQFLSIQKRKISRHYLMLFMNQLMGNLLNSMYLATLSAVDIGKVNVLLFKTSILCITLNAVTYISLETIIVFKSILCQLILLKIMFPFKHQCRWVKWITPASGFVWVIVITIYMIHTFVYQEQEYLIFDRLCSIGWCEMKITFNMLHAIILIVEHLSIVNYIYSFIMIYFSLKKQQSKLKFSKSNRHYTAIAITFKIISVNILEILLRIYLILLLSFKSAHFRFPHFCLYFVICALPINVLFFIFISIVK